MGTVATSESTLLKKGAEASLYLTTWHDKQVLVKARLPKRYRPEQLDLSIRRYRTVHEPQLMHEAKRAGVPTPTLFMVDVENATITMEYIKGEQVKQFLNSNVPKVKRQDLCAKIGELIGRLHVHGVIHGDLTTSNMILTSEGRIFFVDFGLGEKTMEFEARGVDLHLLKRALQSTHYQFAEECFTAATQGYASVLGEDEAEMVFEKIREIEKRGRYIAERKQDAP
jgi:TP53 regulating kinase and related kinases